MFAKWLGFHLVLCSLFFPLLFAYALWYFGFFTPPLPPQQHTIHVVVSCIFHNLTRVIFAVVLSSSYLCSNLIWYWVTSQITWMPPSVDETESRTMGAFLLIRGREEIENQASSALRPVDMVAKASANAGFQFHNNKWKSVPLMVRVVWICTFRSVALLGSDHQNKPVAQQSVVWSFWSRPVSIWSWATQSTKSPQQTDHLQPPELQLGRALSWQQPLHSLCNSTEPEPSADISPPSPGHTGSCSCLSPEE